jgi:glyoxylase-like metal-dependent hydrolase (beta-lactamase superfamily II)
MRLALSDSPTVPDIERFESSGGAQIYRIPMQEFPILSGYAYVVLFEDDEYGDFRVLVDSGSGFGESNQQLERGFEAISEQLRTAFGLEDLTHVFITHGHIDHFGGLKFVRPRTRAKIGVHELDLRNLTNYEERLTVVARRLGQYLIEAGLSSQRRDELLDMYLLTKSLYQSVRVDFTYEAAGMRVGPFEFLHVPGHCAGHVVIRLHDVLFTGDHVLNRTSPHQAPERLTLFTGLKHYLDSLQAVRNWAGDVRLSLGGHETPIPDLDARIQAIRRMHQERLQLALDLLSEPHTVSEVSLAMFGRVHGYNVLLALEEAGAHVEYLYNRGRLGIANLSDLASGYDPVPIRYQRLETGERDG